MFVAVPACEVNFEVIGVDLLLVTERIAWDYMLPIISFFVALFLGHCWDRDEVLAEVSRESGIGQSVAKGWLFLVRYVAPFVVSQIIVLTVLQDFESLKRTTEIVTEVLSIIDAVVILLVIVGGAFHLVRRRRLATLMPNGTKDTRSP